MRRPDRNIEVFSISVLDLFASALGAFIMCAIILYPYYRQDVSKELSEAKASLEQAENNLKSEKENVRKLQEQAKKQEPQALKAREETAQLNRCHNETKQCRAELAKNFLMVQVRWQSSVAVNLHVTDADNNEFFWAKTNRTGRDYPKSKAQLRNPVVSGDGIAVWVDPAAKIGAYHIDYVLRRNPNQTIEVFGVVYDRNGMKSLPKKMLQNNTKRVRAATIQISDDGSVTVR